MNWYLVSLISVIAIIAVLNLVVLFFLPFSLYSISVIVFIDIMAVIVYRDRKKFTRESILLLRKTQRGKQFIIKLGTRFPRFWKVLGVISVVVGFVMSVWIIYEFSLLTVKSLVERKPVMGAGIVIPSPSPEASIGPGYFSVPFWYWIVSIALLVIVHEGLHGIMAAMEKVRIKSLGWGLLAVIPLAFVEPDEKQLQKKKAWSQLRVFSAGSFANFILAGLVALISLTVFSGFYTQDGVRFAGLIEGSPAENVNLTGIIVRINNYTIKNTTDLNFALSEIGINKTITVYTRVTTANGSEMKTFTLTTVAEPNATGSTKGFIGISLNPGNANLNTIKPELKAYAQHIEFFNFMLFWIFLINFGVGAFNLLPIRGLDGGRMWEIVFQKINRKYARKAINIMSYVLIFLLLVNFLPLFGFL